jgi:hypothetical protein
MVWPHLAAIALGSRDLLLTHGDYYLPSQLPEGERRRNIFEEAHAFLLSYYLAPTNPSPSIPYLSQPACPYLSLSLAFLYVEQVEPADAS